MLCRRRKRNPKRRQKKWRSKPTEWFIHIRIQPIHTDTATSISTPQFNWEQRSLTKNVISQESSINDEAKSPLDNRVRLQLLAHLVPQSHLEGVSAKQVVLFVLGISECWVFIYCPSVQNSVLNSCITFQILSSAFFLISLWLCASLRFFEGEFYTRRTFEYFSEKVRLALFSGDLFETLLFLLRDRSNEFDLWSCLLDPL